MRALLVLLFEAMALLVWSTGLGAAGIASLAAGYTPWAMALTAHCLRAPVWLASGDVAWAHTHLATARLWPHGAETAKAVAALDARLAPYPTRAKPDGAMPDDSHPPERT